MAWIRSGECCRCGECCVGDPFPDKTDPNASEAMRQQPVVAGYCPLFRWHEGAAEGSGFCSGHTGVVPPGEEDPYYLAGCHEWPTDPSNIVNCPSCTYTFQWVDD